MHDGAMSGAQQLSLHSVDMIGDATVLLTAPFFLDRDPLAVCPTVAISGISHLTPTDSLVSAPSTFQSLFKGTLTYDDDVVDRSFLQFQASSTFARSVAATLAAIFHDEGATKRQKLSLEGVLFDDGYGAIALTVRIPDGWSSHRRQRTLEVVGRPRREVFAASVRASVLPELSELVRTCSGNADAGALLPYFNMTYIGESSVDEPGRGALAAHLRQLVYPDSPEPLRSVSPWRDQYFYAGYAYSILIMNEPREQIRKLTQLFILLDVLYARLARTATAADRALSQQTVSDPEALSRLSGQLRSQYQALVTPTFSYDHHVLRLRNAILLAWDTDQLHHRTQDLLQMVKESVSLRLANEQARRVKRVNVVVMVLTALSVISTGDAAVSLIDYFFG